jgi:hypothetical protein
VNAGSRRRIARTCVSIYPLRVAAAYDESHTSTVPQMQWSAPRHAEKAGCWGQPGKIAALQITTDGIDGLRQGMDMLFEIVRHWAFHFPVSSGQSLPLSSR